MSLRDNLTAIKLQLDKYDKLSHQELFTYCVNEKLRSALNTYNRQLTQTSDYLEFIDPERVFKAYSKQCKKEEKEMILAQLRGELK